MKSHRGYSYNFVIALAACRKNNDRCHPSGNTGHNRVLIDPYIAAQSGSFLGSHPAFFFAGFLGFPSTCFLFAGFWSAFF